MTFELERQLLDLIGDAARVADETVGFRYFDARDVLGFVDGTANPTGAELPDAALIGADAARSTTSRSTTTPRRASPKRRCRRSRTTPEASWRSCATTCRSGARAPASSA
jgi:hypothetical protein